MTILAVVPWLACILCETLAHLAYRMAGRVPHHRLIWTALGIGWPVWVGAFLNFGTIGSSGVLGGILVMLILYTTVSHNKETGAVAQTGG